MEALQMLKFHFKKSRLNFISEWQSAIAADDKEDWLTLMLCTQFLPTVTSKRGNFQKLIKPMIVGKLPYLEN
jgi:hypothetical protein